MTARNPQDQPESPDESWLADTVTIRNLETGDRVVAVEIDEVDEDGKLAKTYLPITEPLDPRANS